MIRLLSYICAFFVFANLCACDAQKYPDFGDHKKEQLLIYSGMTMLPPLVEIADLFEEQCDCEIKITFGSSGHMFTSVQANKIGDIFFPGCDSYLSELQQLDVVVESAVIGFNQIAIFVADGNPHEISSDLSALIDPSLNVVIGNPQTGSIGRETKVVLQERGMYQSASSLAEYLTTGYRGLVQALAKGDADVVLNWRAAGYNPEYKGVIEMIPLSQEIARKKPLAMGLLRYSRHPELAHTFLQVSQSEQGQQIFRKYGFLD